MRGGVTTAGKALQVQVHATLGHCSPRFQAAPEALWDPLSPAIKIKGYGDMLPGHEVSLHPKQPTKSRPQIHVRNLKVPAFSQSTIPAITYVERKSWLCISKVLLRDHPLLGGRSVTGEGRRGGHEGKRKILEGVDQVSVIISQT